MNNGKQKINYVKMLRIQGSRHLSSPVLHLWQNRTIDLNTVG